MQITKDLLTRSAKKVSAQIGVPHTSALNLLAKAGGHKSYEQSKAEGVLSIQDTGDFRDTLRAHGVSWELIFSICPLRGPKDQDEISADEDHVTAQWSRDGQTGSIYRFHWYCLGHAKRLKIRDDDGIIFHPGARCIQTIPVQVCTKCYMDTAGGIDFSTAYLYSEPQKKYFFAGKEDTDETDVWDTVDDEGTNDYFLIRRTLRELWCGRK